MTSKCIFFEAENRSYTTAESDSSDYQSVGRTTNGDEFQPRTDSGNYDTRTETVTQCIDFTEFNHSSPLKNPTPTPDAHHSKDYEIQKALSCMTVDDFDQFLNVFKVITSPNPDMDKNINKASMEHLLSGELLNEEYFNKTHVAELDDKSASANEGVQADNVVNEYTFFDVYDHIESWKRRIRPKVSKIECIAQEYKAIVRQTSAATDTLEVDKRVPETTLEQTFENYDVTTSSSRYLSNIDKYIEIGENRDLLSKIVHSQSQTENNGTYKSLSHTDENHEQNIAHENKGTKEVQLPLIDVASRRTLLVPSTSYLQSGLKSNDGKLDVKTYFIE